MRHNFPMRFSFASWGFAGLAFVLLVGCGGTSGGSTAGASGVATRPEINDTTTRRATGPISEACLFHGRAQATKVRCTCVQAAADLTLSPSDQARGARYFGNIDALQETRQSDAASDRRFWENWNVFADTARELCTA